jgi:hypothetical protein
LLVFTRAENLSGFPKGENLSGFPKGEILSVLPKAEDLSVFPKAEGVSDFHVWDIGQVTVSNFDWLPFTPPPLVTFSGPSRRAPRVVKVHEAVKESGRVLPHPSAIFHAYALAATPWVARHYLV